MGNGCVRPRGPSPGTIEKKHGPASPDRAAADVPLRLASIAIKRGDRASDSRNYRHYCRLCFVQRGYSSRALLSCSLHPPLAPCRLLRNKLCHNGLIGAATRVECYSRARAWQISSSIRRRSELVYRGIPPSRLRHPYLRDPSIEITSTRRRRNGEDARTGRQNRIEFITRDAR